MRILISVLLIIGFTVLSGCIQKDYQKELDLAKSYRLSGQYEKAEMVLNQLIKREKNKDAYKELGNVYLTGYEDFYRAEEAYQNSLKLDPLYVNSLHNMGLVNLKRYENSLDHQGNGNEEYLKKAMEWFDKAIGKDPNFYLTYVEYAKVYFYQKDYSKALEWLEKAIPLNSAYAPIYSVKGQIYLKGLKDFDKAMYNLKKSYSLDPQNGENIYFLAICYAEVKDKQNFIYYFDKYISTLGQRKVDSRIIEDYKMEKDKLLKNLK